MADDVEHFVLGDRFLEKGNSAGGQGFLPELGRFTAGDENDRRVADFIDPAEPVEDQKSIPRDGASTGDIRLEINIENDEVGPFAADATDGSGTIHGGANFVAEGF